MGDWFQEQAAAGSLGLAVPVAMVAGLVSFFSPCVLPLLPGYLSYATGLSGADLAAGEASQRRGRMFLGSVLFVLGFAVVFVLVGAAFGSVGIWLRTWQDEIQKVLGGLLVLLGLVFAGAFSRVLPWLQRDVRFHRIPAVGLGAAPIIGALFAIGWTPCIGPTYGVIVNLTYVDATATRGAVLSLFYALGLGIPFIIAGVAYRKTLGFTGWVRRHQAWVMRIGGALLVVIGVLMLTGGWDHLVQWLQLKLVQNFEVAV